MKLHVVLLTLILISATFYNALDREPGSQKIAGSNTEVYTYRYIAELYEIGDTANLAKEIAQFKAQYPNSPYLPYVKYMEANLALENADYPLARSLYESLLKEDISQEIMGELLLNYSLCLSQMEDYALAMHQLQRIDSEISNPDLSKLANLQKADIYYKTGQYYSAVRAYKQACQDFPERQDIQLSLFTCQVKLNNDEEAQAILNAQDPASGYYPSYAQTWLRYLLDNERYTEFDGFVARISAYKVAGLPAIIDLKIKRALQKGDYKTAQAELNLVPEKKKQFAYYQALIYLNQGKEAAADSLLKTLVSSPVPEIAVPAYLERLKILYKSEPLSAIVQLNNYLKENKSEVMKGELYYTLGYFSYNKEDYPEAIKQLAMAKRYELNRELSSQVDFLTAEAWFASGRSDMALDAFNSYLNQYPEGNARDRAWFYLGYINFVAKDYSRAKPCFEELIKNHPDSSYLNDALYYLAEMDFYLANYNLALQSYLELISRNPDNTASRLRVAQIYYYLNDYNKTQQYLTDLQPSYEVCILKGNVFLAKREFSAAQDQFLLAESFVADRLKKAEAQSYRALCLYQMKKFKEASALYLQLSNEKESPDTYLFLSAKSAYAAKDYHQALELYNSFVEQFPESVHFLPALGGIANAYYNMGNFTQAVKDWISILTRFRNQSAFSDNDLATIRDALLGIELGMKRIDNIDMTSELLALPDTFTSEYIKFELNYVLVKLYADNEMWSDLIVAAEKVRSQFPTLVNDDIQLLMATGLIKLNQYEAADTLLADVYTSSKSNEALLKWAELDILTQNYDSAMQKLWTSFRNVPNGDTWFKLLECSEQNNYSDFDSVWNAGTSYQPTYPQSYVMRMNQLFSAGRFEDTLKMADYVLNNSVSVHDHATAFLTMGRVDFESQTYGSALATFKRVILLFPEYADVCNKAVYYLVKAQIQTLGFQEAGMTLNQYLKYLQPEQINELSKLIEEGR